MPLIAFPEPKDLEVSFIDRVGNSRPLYFNKYDVSNPHPGFGKDPNILNEFGHTKFPMWAHSKITGADIVVNNEMELAQHTADPVASIPEVEVSKSETPKTGW